MDETKQWTARVHVSQDGGITLARVVLETGEHTIQATGEARRNPDDPNVSEIGCELATGRAFMALGQRLIDITAADIAAFSDKPVHVPV